MHIDKKTSDRVYRQAVDGLRNLPNVYFLERHRCNWGDLGHVKATIKGIKALFANNVHFDYVILLTGQDYPIKPNEQIERFLQENEGKLFMEYFPLPCDHWQNLGISGGLDRIEYWHFRLFNRHFSFPNKRGFPIKRKFPEGFKPFGGSSYWCFPRDCIEFIQEFIKQNRSFVNFFKYVDVPDEIFFQTIILNSHFKESVVNDDLRYIDWKDTNSGSPAILCKDDFEKIARSSKLFARKFDITVDANVLDMIDQRILYGSFSVE